MTDAGNGGGNSKIILAAIAIVIIGAVVFFMQGMGGDKDGGGRGGEWPEVPCPPALESPEQQLVTVRQRLEELQGMAGTAGAPANLTDLCQQLMGMQPGPAWEAKSQKIHAAWQAATSTPPNWVTVVEELTGAAN